jgi:hypothetical protein
MTVRRFIASFAVAGAWLATLPPAAAHRVDEYLQATRLSIDLERVDLEIDLTAGVAKAAEVFAWIDTNRDGEISIAEGEAYAREMLRSVVLKVDGLPAPVNLVEIACPPFRDMSLGVGTIRLRASARIPAATAGRHQVSFLNMHRTESSVYLVNALVPANPRIQLAEQRRDRAQLGLTLDYTVMSDASSARTPVLLTGLVMAACLLLRRGHSRMYDRRTPRAS